MVICFSAWQLGYRLITGRSSSSGQPMVVLLSGESDQRRQHACTHCTASNAPRVSLRTATANKGDVLIKALHMQQWGRIIFEW